MVIFLALGHYIKLHPKMRDGQGNKRFAQIWGTTALNLGVWGFSLGSGVSTLPAIVLSIYSVIAGGIAIVLANRDERISLADQQNRIEAWESEKKTKYNQRSSG